MTTTAVSFRAFAYAAAAIAAALAVAAYALRPAPVFEAEVPVPIAVSDTAVYRGELRGSRDVGLFSVTLEAGKDYGLALLIYGSEGRLELLDPRGREIAEVLSPGAPQPPWRGSHRMGPGTLAGRRAGTAAERGDDPAVRNLAAGCRRKVPSCSTRGLSAA